MPIYVLAKTLEGVSNILYAISDEGGMDLTKTWINKSKGLFVTKDTQ
jgi:hypothetical protein